MSILQYKYKAHRLVNTLFYVIVFVIGFLLGFGAKEIDFTKLLSQVLMIDNVEAYSIGNYEDIEINEDLIYDYFLKAYPSFDILEYRNIHCIFIEYDTPRLTCLAFTDSVLNNINDIHSQSGLHLQYNFYDTQYKEFYFFSYSFISDSFTSKFSNSDRLFIFTIGEGPQVTNFVIHDNEFYKGFNKLDFSKYTTNLTFNENLFKDNPDFKEVCVNNNDTFSIISNDYSEYINDEVTNRVFSERDFIWFKNGVKGLYTYFYHNKSDNNVKKINKNDSVFGMYANYSWLNSLYEINYTFSSEDSPFYYMLSEKGYTDKYSYYNYTLYPFMVYFNNNEKEYMFNVFYFENPTTTHISSSGNEHGGSGTRLDFDKEVTEDLQYCFYIKNNYNVIKFNKNEWGDIYKDVTILGDTNIHFSTSENESNVQNQGLFSVITNFSSYMSETILFINTNIANFYLAMPLLLRMFILASLTILFIKYLINMLVR